MLYHICYSVICHTYVLHITVRFARAKFNSMLQHKLLLNYASELRKLYSAYVISWNDKFMIEIFNACNLTNVLVMVLLFY
jgi:hypothetical protein